MCCTAVDHQLMDAPVGPCFVDVRRCFLIFSSLSLSLSLFFFFQHYSFRVASGGLQPNSNGGRSLMLKGCSRSRTVEPTQRDEHGRYDRERGGENERPNRPGAEPAWDCLGKRRHQSPSGCLTQFEHTAHLQWTRMNEQQFYACLILSLLTGIS